MAEKLKTCFVIAPIGPDDSKERQHSDDVLDLIINPVITSVGFAPGQRADHLGAPGDITKQIIDRIVNDDLVIADLTGHNPNVFYELAIRHAVRKQYIHLIKVGQKIPFDNVVQRTVFMDPEKPREIEKAKTELKKQVETCMNPKFVVESPLTLTLNYDKLNEGNLVERSLARIIEQLDYLAQRERVRDDNDAAHQARLIKREINRRAEEGGTKGQIIDLFEALKKDLAEVQERGGPLRPPPPGPKRSPGSGKKGN